MFRRGPSLGWTWGKAKDTWQYSEIVPKNANVLQRFANVKNFARTKNITRTQKLIEFREKPTTRRTRLDQERVYYQKWHYLKYCTQMIHYATRTRTDKDLKPLQFYTPADEMSKSDASTLDILIKRVIFSGQDEAKIRNVLEKKRDTRIEDPEDPCLNENLVFTKKMSGRILRSGEHINIPVGAKFIGKMRQSRGSTDRGQFRCVIQLPLSHALPSNATDEWRHLEEKFRIERAKKMERAQGH